LATGVRLHSNENAYIEGLPDLTRYVD